MEAAGGSCALYAEKAPMLQRRRGGCWWFVRVIRREGANATKKAWRLPVVRARYTQRRRQCYEEGVEAAGGSCTLYAEKAPMLQRRRGGCRWFVHVIRREGANATEKAWRLPVVRARYSQRRRQCYREGVEVAGGSCTLYAEKAPMLQRRRGGCRWFVHVIRREGANATEKVWRLLVVRARYTQRRRQCYKEGVEAAGGSCTLDAEKAPMLQRKCGGCRWTAAQEKTKDQIDCVWSRRTLVT